MPRLTRMAMMETVVIISRSVNALDFGTAIAKEDRAGSRAVVEEKSVIFVGACLARERF